MVCNNEGAEQNSSVPSPEPPATQRVGGIPSPSKIGAVKRKEYGNPQQDMADESPIARMKEENKRLISRYATRLQAATSKPQRHNLQLELERRLTENAAIAQQQQDAWEQQRSKVRAWCQQTAERKFCIKEKIGNGKITEADFRKQRLYAEALQYEEEHLWLKRLKQDLLNSPHDERRQRDFVNRILQDRLHPLGSLMCQMQHAVLDKVNPIIAKHQHNLPATFNGNIIEPRQQALSVSSVNAELYDLALEAGNRGMEHGDSNSYEHLHENMIAKEEEEAFQRHFQNISDDVKQDIKFLETLLATVLEPLSTDTALTEQVHEAYFSSIKSSLILLLRLGMRQAEIELSNIMSAKCNTKDLAELEERVQRTACAALHRLASLHNPCFMLDSLVATLKILATNTDENNAKSIGADDLLPRLMTVVLASGMPSLLAEAAYMESFMPVGRALGEAGYCLTVLQSVLTCVQLHTG
ncbi:VPS9 domain-containing protein 1 isoform X2 [Anabrus simplex]